MSLSSEKRPDQLRLASALRRLNAFLAEVERLKASDFPHRDGRDALDVIEESFAEYRQPLNDPEKASDETINSLCLDISFLVEQYTSVLGFILRSTNVRNPFEVHYPLKRIVTDVIGQNAKLLISSEWDFVPFTYPMSLGILPEFVLVGGPAPESSNTLITPLAGHEIGHSVWRQMNIQSTIEEALSVRVDAELSLLPPGKRELFSEFKLGDLGLELIKDDCVEFGIQQLEEVFCDLFGLRLFGASYVYAFEYFLAPGGEEVSLDYPSAQRRMHIIKQAADKLAIDVRGNPYDGWFEATSTSEREKVISHIIDNSTAHFLDVIKESAFDALSHDSTQLPRPQVIKNAEDAFRHSEPLAEVATLPEIVTAGWHCVLDRGGMADDPVQFAILNDIMLKSVEVSEYLIKVPHAQR